MAFNLQDYETVEQRIRKFYELHPDGRIVTEWCDFAQEEGDKPWRWLFKATIYLTAQDQQERLPKSVGYASEREVGKQAEWSAELAETSSIGRALANMNLSGNKRASREEMQKVERVENEPAKDWIALASDLEWKDDIDGLMNLYAEASRLKAPTETLEKVAEIGTRLRAKTATKQPK